MVGRDEVDASLRMALDGRRARLRCAATKAPSVPSASSSCPRSPNQAAYLRALDRHDLVFALGPAGTGKTYLAVAMGVALLKQRPGRAHHSVAAGGRGGRAAGLPAGRSEGEGRPLYAPALRRAAGHAARGQAAAADRDRPDRDRPARLHARPDAAAMPIVILDEAQNTTPSQMKMFLTRLGENSRMVITGDPTQTDLPPGMPSGLARRGRQAARAPGGERGPVRQQGRGPPSAGRRDHRGLRGWRRGRPPKPREETPRPTPWAGPLRYMDSDSSHSIEVTVETTAWHAAVTDPEQLCRRVVAAVLVREAGSRRRRGQHRSGRRPACTASTATIAARTGRPTCSRSRARADPTGADCRRRGEPLLLGDVVVAAETARPRGGGRGQDARPIICAISWSTAPCTCWATTTRRTTRPSGWKRGRSSCWPASASPTPTGAECRRE